MKKPDEIKKGLEHCMSARCDLLGTCPYEYECNHVDIHVLEREALAYIQQLEADNAQLNRCIENMTDKLNAAHDETVELKRERDAAVEACGKFPCESCAESENGDNCNWCAVVNGRRTGYVWHGVKDTHTGASDG